MPKKAAPKDAKKRTKKPGKIADLPAKSMKAKDAAKVKGGAFDAFHKIEGATAEKHPGTLSTEFLKVTR